MIEYVLLLFMHFTGNFINTPYTPPVQICHSCGSNVQEIDVGTSVVVVEDDEKEARLILDRVFVRQNLVCKTLMELPYYSAGYKDICIHCGEDEDLVVNEGKYPICGKCVASKKKPINRRGGKAPKN